MRSAEVTLPSWLYGGDLAGFATAAGWRWEVVAGAEECGRIRLFERAAGRDGRLVDVRLMADAGNVGQAGAYARLSPLRRHAGLHQTDPTAVMAELQRLRAQHPNDVGAWLSAVQIAVTAATTEQVAGTLQEALRRNILPSLPDAATYLIAVDDRLPFRAAALRVLLYLASDPTAGPPAQVADNLIFRSATGLVGDLNIGLHAYLAPLFLSCAPHVWGMTASRAGGVVVIVFGKAITGRRGESAEPLQLFAPITSKAARPPRPTFGRQQQQAALQWWVRQLDRLLTEVFDPANYAQGGVLNASRAFEVHLSTEQFFRTNQSLSVSDRDPIARRTMMFDALDTLQGLTGTHFDTLCMLGHARGVLEDLQSGLAPDVGAVLLPRAVRAVVALRELQDGFFLPSRVSSGSIRLPDSNGPDRAVPLESATATWLRVLRNAGHGFGSRPKVKARDDALLVAHDGLVPTDLPDLAYLYLLQLLAQPELLRRT